MDPITDLTLALQAAGVPTHTIATIIAVFGAAVAISAVLTKYVPAPAAEPVTRLGRIWATIYPAVNWLAQNSRYAANAAKPKP